MNRTYVSIIRTQYCEHNCSQKRIYKNKFSEFQSVKNATIIQKKTTLLMSSTKELYYTKQKKKVTFIYVGRTFRSNDNEFWFLHVATNLLFTWIFNVLLANKRNCKKETFFRWVGIRFQCKMLQDVSVIELLTTMDSVVLYNTKDR